LSAEKARKQTKTEHGEKNDQNFGSFVLRLVKIELKIQNNFIYFLASTDQID